jgi:hypothetical protein
VAGHAALALNFAVAVSDNKIKGTKIDSLMTLQKNSAAMPV